MPVRDAAKAACPLQCRLRHGAASHDPDDQVDWAGLPINLDLAFSQAQRDKVYAQHLLRKRQTQLRRWLPHGAQLCICEDTADTAEDANLEAEAAKDYVTS